jgi:hypothetical protein
MEPTEPMWDLLFLPTVHVSIKCLFFPGFGKSNQIIYKKQKKSFQFRVFSYL